MTRKKTDYWKAIRERLHEESGLHYPQNVMGQLLNIFFNSMLNQFSDDNRLFVDQGFLITSEGIYLDIRGKELGLPRKEGKYAEGNVVFTLTREIDQRKTPKPLPEEEGDIIYDYTDEDVQIILDQLNEKRKKSKDYSTILEAREATSVFTIPENTIIYSNSGFEYALTSDVVFEKGQKTAKGHVKAKDSGEKYNALIDTLTVFGESNFPIDIASKTVELVNQKSCPNGYKFKTGVLGASEQRFEIIVKNGNPVYVTRDGETYLKPVYDSYGRKTTLGVGESIQTAIFKKSIIETTTNSDGTTSDTTLTIATKSINIKNDTGTITTPKTILNYDNKNSYKFLTYIKAVGGNDINKDLIVTNNEMIDGGEDGETDDQYRQRLLNNINTNITINYLKKQGIIIYSKKNHDDDVRTKMTSFNPYLNNMYDVIPPYNEVYDFVKYDLIADQYIMVYIRGW